MQHIFSHVFFFKFKLSTLSLVCLWSLGGGRVYFSDRMRAFSEQNSGFVCDSMFFCQRKNSCLRSFALEFLSEERVYFSERMRALFCNFRILLLARKKCNFEWKVITFANFVGALLSCSCIPEPFFACAQARKTSKNRKIKLPLLFFQQFWGK